MRPTWLSSAESANILRVAARFTQQLRDSLIKRRDFAAGNSLERPLHKRPATS
jgi:hypothetical protein